jgi:hypothetical protein
MLAIAARIQEIFMQVRLVAGKRNSPYGRVTSGANRLRSSVGDDHLALSSLIYRLN